MIRSQAAEIGGMWAGVARTEPGMVSGWHDHGDHESAISMVSGTCGWSSGPAGRKGSMPGPADLVYVGRGAVHRGGNPSDDPADIVVVRTGGGASVFNVDGPDPA